MKILGVALFLGLLLSGCKEAVQQQEISKAQETQEVQDDAAELGDGTQEEDLLEEYDAEDSSAFMLDTPTSPCVDSVLIDGVKHGIKDEAIKLLYAKAGGPVNAEMGQKLQDGIHGSDIVFSNIYGEADGECTATVTITYYGNDKTPSQLISNMVRLLNAHIPQTNTLADVATGLMLQQGINELYIDRNNIRELSFDGQSFSAQIRYHEREYFSEDGTRQAGWRAFWGLTPNLLASVALYDTVTQTVNEQLQRRAQQQ